MTAKLFTLLTSGACQRIHAIEFCQQNYITFFIFSPTHTSHKLQPLNLAFFKPFKTEEEKRISKKLEFSSIIQISSQMRILRLLKLQKVNAELFFYIYKRTFK